jgi:Sep15/SelM redox domain
LNRYPELKSFLKDGEAERYAGIKVTYVAGRTAVLTIYKDNIKTEEVVLHELANKAAMHALFRQKGFVLNSELEKQGTDQGVEGTDSAAGPSNQTALSAQQQQEAAEAAAVQVLRLGAAAALQRQDAAAGAGGGRRRKKISNSKNDRNKKNDPASSSSSSSKAARRELDGSFPSGSSVGEMLQLYAFLTAAVILAAGSYKGLRNRSRSLGSGGGGGFSSRWRQLRGR